MNAINKIFTCKTYSIKNVLKPVRMINQGTTIPSDKCYSKAITCNETLSHTPGCPAIFLYLMRWHPKTLHKDIEICG